MYKKIFFFLIAILIVFLFVYVWFFTQQKPTEKIPPTIPTPTSIEVPITTYDIPLNIANIPTLSPKENGGVNTNAPIVQESENQIKKINTFLPYETTFTSSHGLPISIRIPEKNLQDNPWSLTVYIFGIDYQVPQESSDYQNMKTSFIEGSTTIFTWLKKNDVDINKLFIVWGDRDFIQQRSEQWLEEK